MSPEDLHNEIVTYCKSNINEEIIKKYSRYFKEGQWDAYGLTQEQIKTKTNYFLGKKDIDIPLLRETSKILVRSTKFEETSFAIYFYRSFKKKFTRDTYRDITHWFETAIRNWAHCDGVCGELIYPLLEKDIISYKDLEPWINANNKFQRRAVPVSLIKLLKTTDDFIPLFNLIEPLMIDPDREVHQGVGWFLREAWKKQKLSTETFLLKWKDKSPRLIFQYACEKMSPDAKIMFKRTKLQN